MKAKFLVFGLATLFTASSWAGVKATCSVGYTKVDHARQSIIQGGSDKDIVIDLKPIRAVEGQWWAGTGSYSTDKYSFQFFVGYYGVCELGYGCDGEDQRLKKENTASLYIRLIDTSGGKQKVIGAAEIRRQPLTSLGRFGGIGIGSEVKNIVATQAIQDSGKIPGDFSLDYGEMNASGLVPDGTIASGDITCQFKLTPSQ